MIATTLPVKRLEVDGTKQKVIAQFKTPVVRAGKPEPLQIASHMVVAEGHAAVRLKVLALFHLKMN